MNKFKIEKGISRITRVKLQATMEESIAADLALLGEWSNNDKNYIVNELLRFALSQDITSRWWDVFRTVISSGRLEELLTETSCRVSKTGYVTISKEDYAVHSR